MAQRVNQRPVLMNGIQTGMTSSSPERAARISQAFARGLGFKVVPGATLAAHQSANTSAWNFQPNTYNRRPTA